MSSSIALRAQIPALLNTTFSPDTHGGMPASSTNYEITFPATRQVLVDLKGVWKDAVFLPMAAATPPLITLLDTGISCILP